MRKFLKLAAVFLCAALVCTSIPPTTANAAPSGAQTVNISVEYGQTEARSMLQMINDFRADSAQAWAWNETNSEKVQYSGLQGLQYDYDLEKIAMLRAAEIALSFSHTRPNGELGLYLALPLGCYAAGENIAAGQRTAAAVFESWKETDENYSGQGHRRNMLSSKFNAIGIGHVVYGGTHYWVQLFGNKSLNSSETPANNSKQNTAI